MAMPGNAAHSSRKMRSVAVGRPMRVDRSRRRSAPCSARSRVCAGRPSRPTTASRGRRRATSTSAHGAIGHARRFGRCGRSWVARHSARSHALLLRHVTCHAHACIGKLSVWGKRLEKKNTFMRAGLFACVRRHLCSVAQKCTACTFNSGVCVHEGAVSPFAPLRVAPLRAYFAHRRCCNEVRPEEQLAKAAPRAAPRQGGGGHCTLGVSLRRRLLRRPPCPRRNERVPLPSRSDRGQLREVRSGWRWADF